MKIRPCILLTITLLSLGLWSCENENEYVDPFLEVNPVTFAFEQGISTGTFEVNSNRSWKITGAPEWLAVSPAQGLENQTLTVTLTATANETEKPREATLTVTASTLKKTVSVSQKGKSGQEIVYVSIADLYKMYDASGVSGEAAYVIPDDIRMAATCIYDLSGGNNSSLKNAYLQDETGGIGIRTTADNGYTAGQLITVKLKGASLSKYKGLGKPQLLFSNESATVTEGTLPAAKELTIDQVVTEGKYHSMYVKLKGVQFVKYKGLTYHDAASTYTGTSRLITSCTENTMEVRTTKYAKFKDDTLPAGRGDLLGIVTLFQNNSGNIIWQCNPCNGDSDAAMSNDPATRCSTGGGIPESAVKTDIASVVNAFANGAVYDRDNYIEGEVLLNPLNGNVPAFVVYVADATAGIALTFSDEQAAISEALPLGAQVKVYIKGAKYQEYKGLIQLGSNNTLSVGMTAVVNNPAPEPLQPKEISISHLVGKKYQAELVKIDPVQFSDISATYGGSRTLEDAAGNTVIVYTRTVADFAKTPVMQGSGPFIGVVSHFDAPQLIIRKLSDLNGMTGRRFTEEAPDPVKASPIAIGELRAMSKGKIEANVKIKGIVTSDVGNDNLAAGNLFLQDATGAIALRFTEAHTYAMGTEMEIWLYGTTRGEFNGLQQVTGLGKEHVMAAAAAELPSPTLITLAQLQADAFQGQLVQIADVQFKDPALTYADNSGNQIIEDAQGNEAVVYTRAAASFAGNRVAQGCGTITGIASIFTAPQLLLRNPDDVAGMTGERFTATEPESGDAVLKTLAEIRSMPETETIKANIKIKGTVTSDVENNNLATGNLFLQDATGAIALRFTEAHAYAMGTEMEVWLYGATRGTYLDLDQISNLSLSAVLSSTASTPPDPVNVSMAQVLSGEYESRLIKLTTVQFVDTDETATFSGNRSLTDTLSRTVTLYTAGYAAFASSPIPQKSGNIVAIASVRNGVVQLHIRNLSDVSEMTEARFTPKEPAPVAGTVFFSEYVEGSSYNKYIEIYNPGSEALGLGGYKIVTCRNGKDTWDGSSVLNLDSYTVPAKGVLVFKHDQAVAYKGDAIATGTHCINFNGNDPIGLFCGDKLIDIIGVFHGGADDFAKDVTLRRKPTVTGPYVSPAKGWDRGQWTDHSVDDVSDLGKHNVN